MLRLYEVVIELVAALEVFFDIVAQKDADLARQGRRASSSVALNLAKVAGHRDRLALAPRISFSARPAERALYP